MLWKCNQYSSPNRNFSREISTLWHRARQTEVFHHFTYSTALHVHRKPRLLSHVHIIVVVQGLKWNIHTHKQHEACYDLSRYAKSSNELRKASVCLALCHRKFEIIRYNSLNSTALIMLLSKSETSAVSMRW